jgi:ABC-type Na+ transport system ATPase subunit NatA
VSSRDAAITKPVGLVEFDGVWLDDRRRCTWALCDVSFVAEPGTVTALLAPPGQGAAEGIVDLLSGRRLPVRGRVVIDGVDVRDLDRVSRRGVIPAEVALDSREHRLTIAGHTVFVSEPTDDTLAAADRVLVFDGGFAEPQRPLVRAG